MSTKVKDQVLDHCTRILDPKLGIRNPDRKQNTGSALFNVFVWQEISNCADQKLKLAWEALEQTPVMQAQWEKLGIDLEGAAAAITLRYDYSFSWGGLIATLAAIAGYFIFLVWQSDREYRQVIAEKFGNGS